MNIMNAQIKQHLKCIDILLDRLSALLKMTPDGTMLDLKKEIEEVKLQLAQLTARK